MDERGDRRGFADHVPVLVAFAVWCVHALVFGHWIVDDAGISYAYARSVAGGHGFVSQPGVEPVEGFSNFTWVVLLVPSFWLHVFDPVVFVKLLSAALVGGAFAALGRMFRDLVPGARVATTVSLVLIALNTPFVVWTISGLEGPLYVLLLALLARGTVRQALAWRNRAAGGAGPARGRAAALGVIAALAAMTRPDAILFAGVYPAWLLVAHVRERRAAKSGGVASAAPSTAAAALRASAATAYVGTYALACIGVLAAFLAFRIAYFHDILPNTYYAKFSPEGTTLGTRVVAAAHRCGDLLKAFTLNPALTGTPLQGAVSLLFAAGVAVLVGVAAIRRRLPAGSEVVALFLLVAAAAFVAMPEDWMGEYRFALAVVPLTYVMVVLAGRGAVAGRSLTIAVALLVAYDASIFAMRSREFARAPTTPFEHVTEAYGRRFNRYARELSVTSGSLLTIDLGGTLWVSELRVYDLGMLCDRTIARTAGGRRPAEFFEYVFERVRPTFISFHSAGWTKLARLDDDPRFRRLYVPIHEAPVGSSGFVAGDYVLKAVADAHPTAFASLRAE